MTRAIPELRARVATARRAGASIGLVATMGALHEGHLSLIRRAKSDCDLAVVSIFVNPAQFGAGEDFEAYPRDEARDLELAAEAGADLAFIPAAREVYPVGFATAVTVSGVSEGLCGSARGRQHFAGVATIVCKLLNMVAPSVAFFGQKDFQQAAVIRRLVADLDIPVRIEVCPTVRESDGLAMSSRNAYLSAEDRVRALALHRALRAAEHAIAAGERSTQRIVAVARAATAELDVVPEYLELVDADTLEPLDHARGRVLVAVAAHVGRARLIDNTLVEIPPLSNLAPHLGAPAAATAGDQSSPQSNPPGPGRTENGAEQPCSA